MTWLILALAVFIGYQARVFFRRRARRAWMRSIGSPLTLLLDNQQDEFEAALRRRWTPEFRKLMGVDDNGYPLEPKAYGEWRGVEELAALSRTCDRCLSVYVAYSAETQCPYCKPLVSATRPLG